MTAPSAEGRLPVGFAEFVHERAPGLVLLARGLLRDPDAAEDVVGDVLSQALPRWNRRDVEDVQLEVERALVDACTSWWRAAARRRPPHPLAEPAAPPAEDPARAPEDGPEDDPGGGLDELDELLTRLRRLPVRQRTVLVLRHFGDMPDEQIADLLDVPAGTVRHHGERGLAALADASARTGGP